MEQYPAICRRAHEFLRRALSGEVVRPGQTTTADVEWWLRQEIAGRGFGSWFHPTVSVQRNTDGGDTRNLASRSGEETIVTGDLIHIDFGIVYLGLHTDQQQHAYVLGPGEHAAPPGLLAGMRAGNRLQDILMAEFQAGRTGNEILAAARSRAASDGLAATIYSHPIGVHGHGAGPTIGLWDQQDGVVGAGDYPLWPDTAYSIELSVAVDVPEWGGQNVRIMLEEDAFFDGDQIEFMDDRQTDLWLI
jgi:Xaa-Pro aminopeptidase